jgi:hypothetical protein
MSYFGHTIKENGNPLVCHILEGKLEGKRSRGRQRKQWLDNIKEWTGRGEESCKRMAQDRKEWSKETWRCAKEIANRQ